MNSYSRRSLLKKATSSLSIPALALTADMTASAAAPLRKSPPNEVKTGGSRMIPLREGYDVWTKKVGSGPIKVLTLHGGPGMTHEYFECFEDFLPRHGIEFYYYDQLGSSYSDQPTDSKLWTVERFREEVEQVRRALGLEDFYLYGQSWGGMLGIEYALKYQKHLCGLVISNMTASMAAYEKHAAELRRKLPADVLQILNKYEATGDYAAPEYQQTMAERVYSQRLCRLDPWPEPVLRSLKHMNEQVYNTLQGPNEFVITGNIKHWDRWKDLHRITVPTLLMTGRYDTMSVEDIRKMGRMIPHSTVSVCENGSHFSLYDDQKAYFRDLLRFLSGPERKIKAPRRL